MTRMVLALVVLSASQAPPSDQSRPESLAAEHRAVAYLAREVPLWSQENHCFSCHNNGDGARALYVAVQHGFQVPEQALAETTRWLLTPAGWEGGPAPGFVDKKLSRIQFAAALTEAYDAGVIRDRKVLVEAGELLLALQEADGSWQVRASGGTVGSPATYGPVLATYMARRSLERAADGRFDSAIAKANRWLQATRPNSLLDAAALALALPSGQPAGKERVNLLLRAQNHDGGWGPQVDTPSEPFDTAIALLALREWNEAEITREPIARGRAFLIAQQYSPGGWPGTTRPPGAQSYAQHISTSAWATLALLLTHSER